MQGSGGQDGGRITTALGSIVSVPGAEAAAVIQTGSAINAVTAAPDGASLAVACADGVLRIYDVATRRLIAGSLVRFAQDLAWR